ncbi:complement C3 alpha chain-like [Loxodonta africana]|uniref:complement C3 alpha chain-like n=1 Tax=Loxodonta africana TaxID=9785 RepID=UPI0030D5E1D7
MGWKDPTEESEGPWERHDGEYTGRHGGPTSPFIPPAVDEEEDFDDIFLEDNMPIRTLFPESWLWRKFSLPKSDSGLSHYTILTNLPDTITTWQFVAVSLKAGRGICVSDPFELTVMKSFFVDLKLPLSVVRNEQVQIQAVLYNFKDSQVRARVELPYKEPLCSASKPGAPSRQAGGQIQQMFHSILLNPQGQTQTELVSRQDILNKVPDTEVEVFVSVQGYTQMLTHQNADGTYHIHKGNPGSTWLTSYVFRIFALAYPTVTTSMLQLDSLCAIAHWIITQRQAEDGHFLEKGPVIMKSMQGGYQGSEADISLTALVLISLNQGKNLCSQESLTGSIKRARGFLEKQLPDIQTTFAIAIVSYALALTNSPRANDRLDTFASLDKTHWPVEQKDRYSLYTIEATAYALLQKLELGRINETHGIAKWLLEKRELGGGFKSTQTTVVALEALTRFREAVHFDGAQDLRVQISSPKRARNVEWLIDQNNAYLQRSAKFSAQDDLVIKASGTGRGTISILTMYHRILESEDRTCNQYNLNVTLHSAPEENKKGEETFRLRMQTRWGHWDLEREWRQGHLEGGYYTSSGEGRWQLGAEWGHWGERQKDSRKRDWDCEIPRFLGDRAATMTMMEVSLLTGFYPNKDDLKQLTSDVEMYAFQYETKTSSSDSTVVLYLDKLSHEEDTVLGFRVHRMLQAELLQAALVTVYDYYEPCEQGPGAGEASRGTLRCSAFYNLPAEDSSLRKICHKDVCRCAEGEAGGDTGARATSCLPSGLS